MPAISFGGRRGATLDLASPIMLAAGCFGRGAGQQREWLRGVGAVVTHTITPEQRGRGAYPLIHEAVGGLLYSTGLPNRGFARELAEGAAAWAALPVPVIVSLAADDVRTLASMAAELDAASCAGAIELHIEPVPAAGTTGIAQRVAAITGVTALPVIVKLPPVPPPLAAAHAAIAAGADALCVAHGWPATPVEAGADDALLAGPAITPLTLRLVTELNSAGLSPLIGCGGIDSVHTAEAYLAAGAAAVQVGSSLFREPTLATRLAAALAGGRSPASWRRDAHADLDPRRSSGIA